MTDHDALIVRDARPSDVDTLAELARKEADFAQQLAGYYRIAPDFDWVGFVQGKLNRGSRKILLAEIAGRLIGFAEIGIRAHATPVPSRSLLWFLPRRRKARKSSPLEPLSLGVIEGIFVEAQYRRLGTGKALVEAGLAWLQLKGIRRVELGVLANNVEGRNFWQQSGFRTYRLLLYRSLDDASPTDGTH